MSNIQYCKAGRHFVERENYNPKLSICYICERASRWNVISNTMSTANVLFETLPNGHWRASWLRLGVTSSDLIATGRDKAFYAMPEVDLAKRAYNTIMGNIQAGFTPDPHILFNGTVRAVYLTLPLGGMSSQMNMVLRRLKSQDRLPTQRLGTSGTWTFWCPKIDFTDPMLLRYDIMDIMVYDERMNPVKVDGLRYSARKEEPVFSAHQFNWEDLHGRFFAYMTVQRKGSFIFDLVFG